MMADWRAVLSNGRTKLHHVASNGLIHKLRPFLQSSDLLITDKRGVTVLHELSRNGHLYQVAHLIEPIMLTRKDTNGVTRKFFFKILGLSSIFSFI